MSRVSGLYTESAVRQPPQVYVTKAAAFELIGVQKPGVLGLEMVQELQNPWHRFHNIEALVESNADRVKAESRDGTLIVKLRGEISRIDHSEAARIATRLNLDFGIPYAAASEIARLFGCDASRVCGTLAGDGYAHLLSQNPEVMVDSFAEGAGIAPKDPRTGALIVAAQRYEKMAASGAGHFISRPAGSVCVDDPDFDCFIGDIFADEGEQAQAGDVVRVIPREETDIGMGLDNLETLAEHEEWYGDPADRSEAP